MIDFGGRATTLRTGEVGHVHARLSARSRVAAVLLVVLGLALVAAPFAMQMFSRAPQGATMLAEFRPFMTSERLAGFSADLDTIDGSVRELDTAHAERVSPSYATFSTQWPAIHEDMAGLMDDVTANLGNYEAVAGLPSFRLFPWFFLAPGVLLVGAGALTLRRQRWGRGTRVLLGVLGVGLVAGPLALGMFSKASQGAEMMSAFRSLETTGNVARIQGYFSQMAVGQGAIRLEVVPALERSATAEDVARRFPLTTRLNETWVHILNDMTPMIGAMSDNVGHYDALVALPPFGLLPWFFAAPGALVLVLLLVGRSAPRRPEEVPA